MEFNPRYRGNGFLWSPYQQSWKIDVFWPSLSGNFQDINKNVRFKQIVCCCSESRTLENLLKNTGIQLKRSWQITVYSQGLQTITEADRESYHDVRRASGDISLMLHNSSHQRSPAGENRRNLPSLNDSPVTASSSPLSSRMPSRAASLTPSAVPTPVGSLRHEVKSLRKEDPKPASQEEPSSTDATKEG